MNIPQQIEFLQKAQTATRIQRRTIDKEEPWETLSGPLARCNFAMFEYRVAPECGLPRVMYINHYPSPYGANAHPSKEQAMKNADHTCIRKAVKYVEVLD